jgi:hypothetical protein
MSFLRFINFPVFLASFLIGLLIVYIYVPDNKKIYVYPTPETVDILQYRDKSGQCFSFKQKTVDCPREEGMVEKIPMQI